jgi:GAF domain-containing protein
VSFWISLIILVIALAVTAAILWRRLRSRRALEARVSELSTLAEVGRAIQGAQLDLDRLAELVYQQAGQIVDTSIFQLGLLDGDRYRLLIWVVDGQRRPTSEFKLTPDSPGIVGWMRESKRHLLVQDFESQLDSLPAKPRYISDDPPRSAVFVPLIVRDTVLGAMAIQSRRPNAFSDHHVRLLSIVANHAAAALANGRLYEQARRRAAQLELLSEVSQQINAIQPLPALYRQVVNLVAEKFGEYEVSFYEQSERGLTLRATTRPDDGQSSLPASGPAGEAAALRVPVVVQNLPEYPSELGRQPAAAALAEVALPIEIDGRVFGVLDVRSRSPLDDSAVSVFKSLTEQMAIAILEARVYAAEQRRAEHLAAIAQMSRAVASTLELDDLFDEVLDLVDEHFGYQRVHIFLLQDNELIFRTGIGRGASRWAMDGVAYALDGPSIIAAAGRSGQPVLIHDTAVHAGFVPVPGLEDTRSQMTAPMLIAQRLLGVLDIQSEHPHAFDGEDEQTLQTLADTLAIAVRNARLFDAERRRRRLAEILREVSAALTATLELDTVFDLILNGLARVVNYNVASILLVDGELNEFVLRASRGSPDAIRVLGEVLDVELLTGDASIGRPLPSTVDFNEVDRRHQYHALINLPDPHVCLGAVLALGGEHRGYLVVDRAGSGHYSVEERELITAFASQAAVAIENARLYSLQREQTWVSATLLEVAEATAHASELGEVLETVAQLTPTLAGVEQCAVFLSEGDELVLAASGGAQADLFDPEAPFHFPLQDWPYLADMVAAGVPGVIEPPDSEGEGAGDGKLPPFLREMFEGVAILMPLTAKTQVRVQGALIVGQTPGAAPFTAQRIRLLGGIANQLSTAIESTLLLQSQQEEGWVSAALLQVAEAVVSQPTLEESLETVARLIPMLVGIEKVAIFRPDDSGQTLYARQVMGLEREAATRAQQLPVALHELGIDATSETASLAFELALPNGIAQALEIRVAMIWPLKTRGDLLGVLLVEHTPLLGRRLSILNGIAQQLAMAMENARLSREVAAQQRLERELELGRDIQASFLPDACPTFPNWEVCSYWHLARQVGGDFYDFIPLPPSPEGRARWGIVIADVADKGVPAALFMALSRTLLRTVAINRVQPALTLMRTNQLIMADARSSQFVTAFYGVWEPDGGKFCYATGGHNMPVWVSADGVARILPGRGAALGVFEEANYQEYSVDFQPGDVMLLYTDGLTDAVNFEKEEFGLNRVKEVMVQARAESAANILEMLAASVKAHTGGMEAFDDLTMVALKRVS